MFKTLRASLLLTAAVAQPAALAQVAGTESLEELEEVVVVGRLPGPPLWKVTNGDHVLWILPLINMYPKKMEWESARVEALIAQSEEYIERPRAVQGISTANPLTLLRVAGLARRGPRLPDGQTLADVLPAELHRRYSVLKARYLPRNTSIETMTISAAGGQLQRQILDQENLETLSYNRVDSPQLITDKLRQWLKRNKTIRRTNPTHGTMHAISGKDIKMVRNALEEASTSAAFGSWEAACFEKIVAYFENDLEPVKKRANAWAQGQADDLIDPTPLRGRSDACSKPPVVPEGNPAMAKLRNENPGLVAMLNNDRSDAERISREKWLAAAEAALAGNATTFSMLAVSDILDEGGLVSRLKAKGYSVEISAESPQGIRPAQ
ncbi:MAG TPA: TraB/GumN family protein [Steroidobacteraceae bacterium]|nr:TraB/GumN family protein [Steroidobacteraceae bacterium]